MTEDQETEAALLLDAVAYAVAACIRLYSIGRHDDSAAIYEALAGRFSGIVGVTKATALAVTYMQVVEESISTMPEDESLARVTANEARLAFVAAKCAGGVQ